MALYAGLLRGDPSPAWAPPPLPSAPRPQVPPLTPPLRPSDFPANRRDTYDFSSYPDAVGSPSFSPSLPPTPRSADANGRPPDPRLAALYSHGRSRRRNYRCYRTLGSGTDGTVRACVAADSGRTFAMKVAHKPHVASGAAQAERDAVAEEVERMRRDLRRRFDAVAAMRHKNLPEMVEHFETEDKFYTIMELGACDLQSYLRDRGPLSEDELRAVMTPLLRAVAHLHSRGVAHRDLKPGNVMLRSPNDPTDLFLADFDAAFVGAESDKSTPLPMKTFVGTPFYLSPELVAGDAYSPAVDVYAAGCLAYQLAFGTTPFENSSSFLDLYSRIADSDWCFPPGLGSPGLRDFVASMMRADPASRPTAEEALAHPWLAAPRRRRTSGVPVVFDAGTGELRFEEGWEVPHTTVWKSRSDDVA
ncbi:kinase-like domain-containing protein [Hyaloraphidium curvatum]|nr:kinase-like domain-containing protein [Hyaloraphidium curvatum]